MAEITVRSMVSMRTREPMVSIYWPSNQDAAQMTPAEARLFALSIFESAEAAEQDGFLFQWGKEWAALDDHAAAGLINEYRKWRARRAGKPDEPAPDGDPETVG